MYIETDALWGDATGQSASDDAVLQAVLVPLADLPLGLVIIDASACIRLFNAMAGYFLGIPPAFAIGRTVGEVLPGAGITDFLETGTPCYDRKQLVNQRILRCSFVPIKIGQRVAFVAQFMQDQSEEIQLQSELEQLRDKYETLDTLLDRSFEELGVVDRDGRMIYVTRKSARNMGYSREEILGRDVTTIYPRCLLKKVAQTGVPEVAKISRPRKKTVPVVVMPLVKDGAVEGAVCKSVFTDLNEAKDFIIRLQTLNNEFIRETNSRKNGTSRFTFDDIVGQSKAILAAKKKAARSAKGDSNILITGETGTGKELFARAIHAESMRRNGPFVAVNCAAIPDSLLESELFGYDHGSFTGARKGGKPGKFELAHNGTLLLDECADMSIGMQAKLLRVIQEKEFERVGGTVTYVVDVRILAATNTNLWEMVQKGQFREDLYYRLDVVNIEIAPLRSRIDDVAILAQHFIPHIRKVTESNVQGLTEDVLDLFAKYPWPGNVRELRNVLEGAMNFNTGALIDIPSLPSRLRKAMGYVRLEDHEVEPLQSASVYDRAGSEKAMIENALKTTKGNKRQTAKLLKMSRATLYNKLTKYGIEHVGENRI